MSSGQGRLLADIDVTESVRGSNGEVLLFSWRDFAAVVRDENRCFMCGASRDDVAFNAEHVVPNWLLRRHDLATMQVTLPNGTRIRYGAYTVPCCVACNDLLGRRFEAPVRELLSRGRDALVDTLTSGELELLFAWACLVFFKTHYKDTFLRVDRDERQPDVRLGSLHNWELLYFAHTIARSYAHGALSLAREAMGTLVLLKAAPDLEFTHGSPAASVDYHYADLIDCGSLFVRTGDVALQCTLDDAGFVAEARGPLLEQVQSAALSPLQLLEVFARLSHANRCFAPRPIVLVRTSATQVRVDCIPVGSSLPGGLDEAYGAILHYLTAVYPMHPKDRELIRSGQGTFFPVGPLPSA